MYMPEPTLEPSIFVLCNHIEFPADIRIFTHYSNMSGSGTRRTEDFHTLRTRQLILQNQDGTYPSQGHFLSVNSSRGLIGESDITILGGGTVVLVQNIISTGDAYLEGNMQVNGVTVMSSADISGTLSVGNRTFLRETDISGSVYAYGYTNLIDCNITENAQFGALDMLGYLNVDGSCNFGSLNVQGTTVLNNITINGIANVGTIALQNIDLSGYMNVDGSCNIIGDLSVQGDTVLNNLIVTGTNNIVYTSLNWDISGYLNAGSCNIAGDTTIGSLRVAQNSQCANTDISGYVNVGGSCDVGSLNVKGASVLNDVTVTGTYFLTKLDVSGYLTVDGSCNLVGATTAGTLSVAQKAQLRNVDMSGNLRIDGSCNIISLTVSGNSELNNLIFRGTYFSKNLDISGYLNVDGSCNLVGNTTGGTLRVAQKSQFRDVDMSGNLRIDGSCNILSLNVSGASVLKNLTVTGIANIAPPLNLDISGFLIVDGSSNLVGNTTLGGTLSVAQKAQFRNVDISGYLRVDGSCNFVGKMRVVGNVDISGIVRVNQKTFIQNFIDSSGTSTSASTISITNNGYMYGSVTPTQLNMYASGLPLFGYIVWYVGSSSYTYAPTFPIISTCIGNAFYRMGLPASQPIQDSLQIKYIVVSPYTTIVFNSNAIDSSGGYTCKNNTSPTPKTFVNSGTKIITQITSWYVYRYDTTGKLLDNGSYFLSETFPSGSIT